MSLALTSRLEVLKDRSLMLKKARYFFDQRRVLEVDVPILSNSASIDAHIDLIEAVCLQKKCFLHSSPEYGMKRLLAEGIGDVFQLSHVFRNEEKGERHNPEFTMVEWYREDFSMEEMIQETLEFFQLFFPFDQSYTTMSYKECFQNFLGDYPEDSDTRDYQFSFKIEPLLGKESPFVITKFPKEQAALSMIDEEGFAARFEIYYQGFELANGYRELLDPREQKKRFDAQNRLRKINNKKLYPVDNNYLGALEKGLPPCCGVACGFDRLMMIRHQVDRIEQVLPFGFETA